MKYQLLEHVSLTNVDGEAILLDLNEGFYFGLNHVGALYLNLITQNITHDQAVIDIAQRYAIDYNRVKDDINELTKQLMEQNLLQTVTE